MFDFIFSSLRNGLQKVGANRQLLYTACIAVLIAGAFIFTAERFVGIARSAQDRLINVRIGSLQDGFVPLAVDHIHDAEYLNRRISSIVRLNETIRSFRIVQKQSVLSDDGAYEDVYVVVASNIPAEVGKNDRSAEFLYTLAVADTEHSITHQFMENSERLFKTARAITNSSGLVVGVVMTTQTLSLADSVINADINNSLFVLAAVILLIMLLFLRHSRIVDYMSLYQKLQEVDQTKDDFISMASHELRTPLAAIRGASEMIYESPALPEGLKQYTTMIDVSARGLDALVGDILDVSRIQQGRMLYNTVPTAPHHVINEVINTLRITADEKGLRLVFDVGQIDDSCHILVDPDRFKQILVNLIGNAVKYTEQGEVSVRQYVENGRFYVRVSDTGIGMSADERARLFEKFYRIRNTQTEHIRGTGLGLWITAQMVRDMKGIISVESIKGVGSHFIVSFMLVK